MNLSKNTKSDQAGGDARVIKGLQAAKNGLGCHSKRPQLEVAALKVIQGHDLQGHVEETYKGVCL